MTQALVKYPSTPHLPFSEQINGDDVVSSDLNKFVGKEVIITEKMDGENTTLYPHHLHARSLDSRHHSSRDWIKSFWGNLNWKIPNDVRICGENLYAKHSIFYEDLESYFYGFSAWRGEVCLSWDDTLNLFSELEIIAVPVLYRGHFSLSEVKKVIAGLDLEKQEGIVMRVTDEFQLQNFSSSLAKWVRKGHVQTDEHWMHAAITPNRLRK